MRHWKMGVTSCVQVAILLLTWTGAVVAAPAGHVGNEYRSVGKKQALSGQAHSLAAVAAVAADDVWAVGYSITNNFTSIPLIEHWDGSQWSIVNSPVPAGISSALAGVAAIATNDVWAVGGITINSVTGRTTPLIEHWDGTQWSIVPSPNGEFHGGGLNAVAAVSANDVWAAGLQPDQYSITTLTEHWNGTKWSIIATPAADGVIGLATTMVSTSDVWLVGCSCGNTALTFTEHWDGTKWTIVNSPNRGGRYSNNSLEGAAAIAANNVWAVGYSEVNHNTKLPTLIEHWNGKGWSIVNSPNPHGFSGGSLAAVTALSTSDAWTVGYAIGTSHPTLIERWNGTQWTIVPSPSVQAVNNALTGVAAIAATNVWAVGFTEMGNQSNTLQTLIEHWDGSQWSIIPSPS